MAQQQHPTTTSDDSATPRRRRHVPVALLGILAASAAIAQPAAAAKPYPIDGGGMGTYVLDDPSAPALTGSFTGAPFDGTYTASFGATDGSLPAPGECEPGHATLRVDGTRGKFVELSADGQVCGKWTDATYVVTHDFTGRYLVEASSSRRLVGTDGFMSQLIANNGLANVYAIATN